VGLVEEEVNGCIICQGPWGRIVEHGMGGGVTCGKRVRKGGDAVDCEPGTGWEALIPERAGPHDSWPGS
jgi:hypothetical protein